MSLYYSGYWERGLLTRFFYSCPGQAYGFVGWATADSNNTGVCKIWFCGIQVFVRFHVNSLWLTRSQFIPRLEKANVHHLVAIRGYLTMIPQTRSILFPLLKSSFSIKMTCRCRPQSRYWRIAPDRMLNRYISIRLSLRSEQITRQRKFDVALRRRGGGTSLALILYSYLPILRQEIDLSTKVSFPSIDSISNLGCYQKFSFISPYGRRCSRLRISDRVLTHPLVYIVRTVRICLGSRLQIPPFSSLDSALDRIYSLFGAICFADLLTRIVALIKTLQAGTSS